MQLKNTSSSYGMLAILLHWLTALGVIFLFCLGLWMDGLDYYHEYYRIAPHIHKSVGVLLICLVLFRFVWRQFNTQPKPLVTHKSWEVILARLVHYIFYLMLLCMLVSGYLITTAEGKGLDVFTWFTLPATVTGIANLEDIAGEIHELLAFTLIGLVSLHSLAALKHHFIDKDSTLKRMIFTGEKK